MLNPLRLVSTGGLILLLLTTSLVNSAPQPEASQAGALPGLGAKTGMVNFKPTAQAIVIDDHTYRIDEKTIVIGRYKQRLAPDSLEVDQFVRFYRAAGDADYIARLELIE